MTLTKLTNSEYEFLKTMSSSIGMYQLMYLFEASIREIPVQTKLSLEEFKVLCGILFDSKHKAAVESCASDLMISPVIEWVSQLQHSEFEHGNEDPIFYPSKIERMAYEFEPSATDNKVKPIRAKLPEME